MRTIEIKHKITGKVLFTHKGKSLWIAPHIRGKGIKPPQEFRICMSEWTKFQEAEYRGDAKEVMKNISHKTVKNNRYQVDIRNLEQGFQHLSIKRLNKDWIHDWRELQRIKNEICGKEREAVEIYPAESRLVDSSNQYHLWVFPEGEKVPFGYSGRLVVEGHDDRGNASKGVVRGSRQRPFDSNPSDCKTMEETQKDAEEMIKKGD